MKEIMRSIFTSKTNYIILGLCYIGMLILKLMPNTQMNLPIAFVKITVACFIGAFIGELIAKYIKKDNK